MKATEILRDEHTQILRALALLDRAADRLDRGIDLPDGWWDELLQWLRSYADGRHHAKEEDALFPAMARAGVPVAAGGPIAVMLEEHETGRRLVAMMAGGDAAARAGAARRYVSLLQTHIDKENGVLFPLADAVIDEGEERALRERFAAHSFNGAGDVLDGLSARLG